MPLNRRPIKFSVRALAAFSATLFLGLVTANMPLRAGQQFTGPTCSAPPTPTENDGWPKANPDDLLDAAQSKTFPASTLLANDTGTAPLIVLRVGPTSSKGGSIVESAPGVYTYTGAAGFLGNDVFTYEMSDVAGRTSVGVAHINVTVAAPATTTVPLIVGLTDSAARAAIAAASLTVGTVTSENSANVLAGQVIRQDPAANTSAALNSAVSYVLSLGPVPPPPPPPVTTPTVQVNLSSDGTGPRTTAPFSASANAVLIALAASDGPTSGTNNQNLTISGGGLAWTRVRRVAVQRGVAEIWTATAAAALNNVTVTSTQSVTSVLGLPVNQSLTVLAYTGATGVGASNGASGATGAPRVSLVTQGAGSVVVGVGIDFDRAVARTVPTGQTKIHEFLAPSGDTMWMQGLTSATGAAGSTATLNDTAPTTDQWNFASVEIRGSGSVPPPPPVTVTVPNVVGATQAAAEAAITGAGLIVGTVTTATSGSVPAGSVISQSPAANLSVAPNSAVAITVSLGPATTPSGGLVLAFAFDEASGTTALDTSGSGLNGTIREAVRVAGKTGGALSFDGVNDWVTVTDTTSSPLDLTSGMTIEAWVNPAAMSGWESIVLKERGAGLLSYGLYAQDGAPLSGGFAAPAGYIRTGSADQAVRGTDPLPLGAWTHIATTYDGATMRIYVNGQLVGSRAQGGAIAVANGALRIGGNGSFAGEFFQGLIDDVRIYNRALSAAEISHDMNTPVQ